MTKIVLLILVLCQSGVSDWVEIPDSAITHYKFYRQFHAKQNKWKWRGYPDPNYIWEGNRLFREQITQNEYGNDITTKTYRKPFEIIAEFKDNSKVWGRDNQGKIEEAVVDKFGGSLIGFIWLDNISGGGKVILPFTAPHIFITKGDRLNPVLSEIGTDTSADNYYEIVDGKTHVYVKAFSGIGGAAGAPDTLVGHWKMNEDASDNDELVGGGDFATADWVADNPHPTYWTVTGEVTTDPEVSEVGTGEGHGGTGTGMCNIYTSGGTVYMRNTITYIIGRKYTFSINIDTVTAGGLLITDVVNAQWPNILYNTTGTKTFTFVATVTTSQLQIIRSAAELTDVTFDDVSIKLCAVEDSSGNDHDMLMQQDTDAISVAGKINRAFDFNGTSDYGEIADADDLTPALTPFSISAWIYMHDVTNFIIASKGVYNTDGEWSFFLTSAGKVAIRRFDESVANCYIGRFYNTALSQNQWIHLVATSNGGILSSGDKIYLNGKRVDDTTSENNAGSFVAVENLTHVVWIGRYSTAYANGLIDNAVIFSTELDIYEIEALYNHGSGTEIMAEIDERRGRRNR